MNIFERLETLRKLNRNPLWVNEDIFRLVCSPDLAKLSYERIKSKAGNMTAGDDGVTLDRISMQSLTEICESIRNGSYTPRPVRRKYIPKANGKMRPLGIPSPRDKIVQDMVREILEAIYDTTESPTFSEHSHGFRPFHSCHTAINEYIKTWQSPKWIIEGDIEGFFDNIDHHVLIGLLRKRIHDERFINLIWKFLRAGVREENRDVVRSDLGTPQGGIISPILANIYLHEFDLWVNGLQTELTKGKRRKPNPEWRKLIRKKEHLLSKGASLDSEEVKAITRQASNLPTVMVDDPDFCRIYYLRYADDWIIGVVGDKELARSIKEHASSFLKDTLKLNLSPEKTLITHATKRFSFLSFDLTINSQVKRSTVHTEGKRASTAKRVTGWTPAALIPVKEVI